MNRNSKTRRRGFGAVCLLAAMGMLVVGATVIEGKLSPVAFLLYWLGCLTFTILAMIAAIVDVRAVRCELRDEQRALLEHALQNGQTKPPPDTLHPKA